MEIKKIAEMLNGREYGKEMKEIDLSELEKKRIVVAFGYSDDNIEFRGAINDEVGCYNGGTILLDKDGLITNNCSDEYCPYYIEKKEKAHHKIIANWDRNGYSWYYESNIPNVSFDILEDGKKYCRGLVFYLPSN